MVVYEKLGFLRTRRFVEEINNGSYPFIEVERPA